VNSLQPGSKYVSLRGGGPRISPRGGWTRSPLLALFASPLLLFLAFPLLALCVRVNVADLASSLFEEPAASAVVLSLATSSLAAGLAILFGTPLAYALGRYRFPGRGVIDTLVDLPMVLPPAVAGVALLVAFGRRGVLGAYLTAAGIDIAFTQTAVVLAQLFVAAPYYVRAAAGAFARVDRDLEEAAALDGAGGWGVVRYVTIPLVWPTLFAGAVMTWARALGEFGATIIFAGNFPGRTQTMPLAIYIGFEIALGTALTLAVVLLAISATVLVTAKWVLRSAFDFEPRR
jgi:molybdate transport system permease protein